MPEITKYCKVILAFPPKKAAPLLAHKKMLQIQLYSTQEIVVSASKCYSKNAHYIEYQSNDEMNDDVSILNVEGKRAYIQQNMSSDMNLHEQCSGGIPSKKSLLWKIYPELSTDLKSVENDARNTMLTRNPLTMICNMF